MRFAICRQHNESPVLSNSESDEDNLSWNKHWKRVTQAVARSCFALDGVQPAVDPSKIDLKRRSYDPQSKDKQGRVSGDGVRDRALEDSAVIFTTQTINDCDD